MKQGTSNGAKRVSINVDQMQLFLIINNLGMMKNVDENVKKWLTMYAIKDMLGIPVIVSVNVLNHVMLVSFQIMEIVNVDKGWQINQWSNVMKILMKQN